MTPKVTLWLRDGDWEALLAMGVQRGKRVRLGDPENIMVSEVVSALIDEWRDEVAPPGKTTNVVNCSCACKELTALERHERFCAAWGQ